MNILLHLMIVCLSISFVAGQACVFGEELVNRSIQLPLTDCGGILLFRDPESAMLACCSCDTCGGVIRRFPQGDYVMRQGFLHSDNNYSAWLKIASTPIEPLTPGIEATTVIPMTDRTRRPRGSRMPQ